MSRLKKISLVSLAFVCLVLALMATLDGAGRSGRIKPAVVPTVSDPFRAGSLALETGDPAVALGYFLQVPKSDRNYNRAQRYIGWEMYAKELGLPVTGIPYVHRALLNEPFSSNSWEDASRTYASILFGRGKRASASTPAPAPAPSGN